MSGAWEPSLEQLAELQATADTNDAMGGKPGFLSRAYYRDPVVGPLIRRGLIAWGPPPDGFEPRRFAGTTVTEAGRAVLRAQEAPHG